MNKFYGLSKLADKLNIPVVYLKEIIEKFNLQGSYVYREYGKQYVFDEVALNLIQYYLKYNDLLSKISILEHNKEYYRQVLYTVRERIDDELWKMKRVVEFNESETINSFNLEQKTIKKLENENKELRRKRWKYRR